MISLQSYVREGRSRLRKWAFDPRIHIVLRSLGYALAGFCLSAASLGGYAQSIAMGLVWACSGWSAVLAAAGGAGGYLLFWGQAGQQGVVWVAFSLVMVLLLSGGGISRSAPLLLPATAGLLVAATGLAFQIAGSDSVPVVIYLLRVGGGFGVTWLFLRIAAGRNPLLEWFACGVGVLALAQIAPIPYLGFGFIAAAALTVGGAFPAAALAGLGLDLAQATPVPMTAVLAGAFLVRFLPKPSKWLCRLFPAVIYVLVMYLCGMWDPYPIPALILGGLAGSFLQGREKVSIRRGETGSTQVRLEMAAGVLAQTRQILMETPEMPVDEDALVQKAAQRACGGCPCRRSCQDSRRIGNLPGILLHKPLLSQEELPVICRKNGRFLAELHRAQEQLRAIHADRQRQGEYRAAVIQQYLFLSDFLQALSDGLANRGQPRLEHYTPDIRVYGNRRKEDNGDRSERFAGTMGKYYVLLCDGMGRGLGAVQEGKKASAMLRRMLQAGYPARHALQSLNSLCALRERAGAVTVDLLELELDTGKATLYKWGAAASYLLSNAGAEKIGTAGPPPGLLAAEAREESFRLSLRRGEMLVMVSDGVGEEEALRCCQTGIRQSPGELATKLLTDQQIDGQDDATVILIRLRGSATAT